MFERFTAESRSVVVRARSVAESRGDPRIGTEHLLLALARPDPDLDPGISALLADAGATPETLVGHLDAGRTDDNLGAERDRRALEQLGIDLSAARAAADRTFGAGSFDAHSPDAGSSNRRWPWSRRRQHSGSGDGRGFSPRAKKALELSLREALRLRHNFIAPEHLALGILAEGEGLGCLLLARTGIGFDELRADLEELLNVPSGRD